MYLTTANIRNNPDMARHKVRADARRAVRQGRPRPARVIALQEIGEAEDRADVRASLPPGWLLMAPQGRPTPLAVSMAWRIHHRAWTKLSDSIPGVNPARGVSWALMTPLLQPGLRPIVVGSVHLANGAFTNPGQRAERERRDRWWMAHEALTAWHAEHLAAGHTVILAGDLNRPRWVPDWSHRTRLVARAGLDYITATEAPGGTRVTPGNVQVNRAGHTDHPILSAHLRLSRGR